MDTKTAARWLKLELRNTFPKTPQYDAINLAIKAVDRMEEAEKDIEIVDRLVNEYHSQVGQYRMKVESGKRIALVDSRSVIKLLGRILGANEEEIEADLGMS